MQNMIAERGARARYLHVKESATFAGVHSAAHIQQQQGGIACQEANGPGGTWGGEGWGLEGGMLKDWQRVKGKGLPWWQSLLKGLNELWSWALHTCSISH